MAKSVRGYTGYNAKVLMKGLTAHVKGVELPKLLDALKRVAEGVVTAIDSGYIPEYTANLHDATGVAIYVDGRVAQFIPTKRAAKKSKSGFDGVNHYDIDGTEFLTRTIMDAATTFSSGVWFVVISAVPYAYYINENGSPKGRGQGFFNKTYEDAVKEILSGLRAVGGTVNTTEGAPI